MKNEYLIELSRKVIIDAIIHQEDAAYTDSMTAPVCDEFEVEKIFFKGIDVTNLLNEVISLTGGDHFRLVNYIKENK